MFIQSCQSLLHCRAQREYELGLAHAEGKGVMCDWKKAFAHYTKAVDLGSKQALVKLGQIYRNGLNAVTIDQKKSTQLYEQAHLAGVEEGTVFFGRALSMGVGVDKDESTAFELLIPFALTNPFAAET